MATEGAPAGFEQDVQFDPVLLVQEQLGVTEEVARDLMDIEVVCPAPGVVAQPQAMRDFLTTEHGRAMSVSLFADARGELTQGQTLVRALRFAFGRAISLDSDGQFVRMASPVEIQPDPAKVLKKNEDEPEVEIVAERVEVRRLVIVEDDFVDAVVGVEAQLEVRVSDDGAHEVAVRLAREHVETELARQELLVEAEVREPFIIEETTPMQIAVPEREAKIIQLRPRTVDGPENVVVDDVEPQVSKVEVAEPVEGQSFEQVAEIIKLDDLRTLNELTEDAITFEADETQMFMVDEDDAKLAEITYQEAWWSESEVELEPLTVADFAKELRVLNASAESDVEVEGELQIELTPEMVAVNEQVVAALEALVAPDEIAEAQDLLDEIMEAVQAFATTPEADAEENLKVKISQLFEFLKIEYDEQMVEQFVKSLLLIQRKRVAIQRAKDRQELEDEGTHERDRHLRISFAQHSLRDDTQPEQLGRVALMVS